MTRTGYDHAFSMVYVKFARPLYRFLFKMVRNRELSQDILQDTFLRIYEKNICLDKASRTLFSYLCKISRNKAIDQIKRAQVERAKYQIIAIEEIILDRHFYTDVEESYIHGEIISTFHDVLDACSSHERDTFLAMGLTDKPLRTVAVESGISIYCAKKIIKKVSDTVRDGLKEYFTDDDVPADNC
jgi:RNA polymerase sigma-70 factor (ECF subfamily)